jgi:hypothetical protein
MDEAFAADASADAALASIGGIPEAVASARSAPAGDTGTLAPAFSGPSG